MRMTLRDGEATDKKCYGFAMYRDLEAWIRVRRRGTLMEVFEGILAGF